MLFTAHQTNKFDLIYEVARYNNPFYSSSSKTHEKLTGKTLQSGALNGCTLASCPTSRNPANNFIFVRWMGKQVNHKKTLIKSGEKVCRLKGCINYKKSVKSRTLHFGKILQYRTLNGRTLISCLDKQESSKKIRNRVLAGQTSQSEKKF